MNRVDLLLNVLDSTYDRENWFAPLKDAIGGITAEQASWRPDGEAAKSIWENVNHLIYYKERLVAGMEGCEWTHSPVGDETFYLTEPSNDDEAWAKVVARADRVQLRLRQLLSDTTAEALAANALESNLLDIFLHDAYHTGQIIQTRKMQGAWPAHR
ncbi:DinB family protein [Paenibacillus sacheonensis]|uniref:DinB family protein n=1 Tax=Paenibacillus sacheonensis TaxID=742054 RepID=A0A7X4YWH2_9BACL|nr:DinB family protein [Paenibacillus sacheonensis]MBM7567256.1 hypothetical protein [Paenibacillus sacheonensis]NBC72849.1 DinB family protein [Paenibacillus sacheonensis]